MDIKIQCCGFAILVFITYFCLRQKSIGTHSEKVFKKALLFTFINVGLDIGSLYAIKYRENLPEIITEAICKTYIVTIIMMGCFIFMYLCMDIYDWKKYKKIAYGCGVLVIITAIIIYCLPIYYYFDYKVIYTYGASVTATYIVAVSFVILSMGILIRCRIIINAGRKRAVTLWLITWFVAACIQFVNNGLLLVSFASCMGMFIIFFELENPEASIDRETGVFNIHALMSYMNQEYENKSSFSAVMIYMERSGIESIDFRKLDQVMLELVQFLENETGAMVFKNVEQEIIAVYKMPNDIKQITKKIYDRFEQGFGKNIAKEEQIELKPLFVVLPDSGVAEDAKEVFKLFRYFKNSGQKYAKNNVIFMDGALVDLRKNRLGIADMIVKALNEDRIDVFYQPIYSTIKKRFVSAEALVRIKRENGSIMVPGLFISIAEENGLIEMIGERVFEKTCQFITEKNIGQYGIDYIEVNLSVKQCESPHLADKYIGIMKKYGVNPSSINLEVTETASLRQKEILINNMQKLIEYGVTFSLDDFGNGQSNLNYIVDMPVKIVKFDMDMTKAYFEKEKGRFVMNATIQMLHEMGLEMVSEGIETKEMLDGMEQAGVQYIQGYYFSKPVPEDKFIELVKKGAEVE